MNLSEIEEEKILLEELQQEYDYTGYDTPEYVEIDSYDALGDFNE